MSFLPIFRNENLKDLANSIDLNQILNLQSKLKGSENYIRNSNQPKLWLEIHLLGMLSSSSATLNTNTKQSSIKNDLSINYDPDYTSKLSEKLNSSTKNESIKENLDTKEPKPIPSENLELQAILDKMNINSLQISYKI